MCLPFKISSNDIKLDDSYVFALHGQKIDCVDLWEDIDFYLNWRFSMSFEKEYRVIEWDVIDDKQKYHFFNKPVDIKIRINYEKSDTGKQENHVFYTSRIH